MMKEKETKKGEKKMGIINLVTNFSSEHWVIRPENLEQMTAVLQAKYDTGAITSVLNNIGDANILTETSQPSILGDTLFFPITGVLLPRASFIESVCGFTGTNTIKAQLIDIVNSNRGKIDRVIFHIDSPGGAVTGVPELAKVIKELGESIETVAFSDTIMTSGAQWIAAACNTTVTTPSAIVGSVGVYREIVKIVDDKMQVKIIKAGGNKAFGHPYLELSDEEIKAAQDSVNTIYDQFTQSVADYKGMTQQEVKNTEAKAAPARDFSVFVDKQVTTINELF